MNNEGSFLVKLNCKNMNSIRSLIIDRQTKNIDKKEKYILCAGKYDKNGWTFIIRTNTYEEAKKLANLNFFEYRKIKIN